MSRANHLQHSQQRLLWDWGGRLFAAFHGQHMPYLVGSALTRSDWRDVDVRILLPASDYDALMRVINRERLALALSLWGQQATGLPIDCQVQRIDEANARHPGPRSPIGTVLSDGSGEA